MARATLSQVARGSARTVWLFPGLDFVVIAYVATACGLIGHSYEHLWGVLAALVAGIAWYASPLGRLEATRRKRLRAAPNAAAT